MAIALNRFFTSAFFGWLVLAVVGGAYLFTIKDGALRLREDRLKFGIDLAGGTYITLSVDTQKALEAELFDKQQALLKRLQEHGAAAPVAHAIKDNHVLFTFETPAALNEAMSVVSSKETGLKVTSESTTLKVAFKDVVVEKIKQAAVQGNIEVLRTRLDNLGVGEITIAAQGEQNIVIELPNVDDPQEAKKMIGKAALLEIKLVERKGMSEEDILDEYDGELPDDMEILKGKPGPRGEVQYFMVPKYTDLTGRLLKDAYAGFGGQTGSDVVVHFRLSPEGGDKFYDLTRKNFNREIAIILDGVVISYPRVNTPISSEGYIQGSFAQQEAMELAMLLKSGAFVAPVKFEEERQIRPTLGQEAIRSGVLACLVGLALLFIFSVVIYKMSGLFAFLALLYNLLVILLALSWMRATLTLPGIAGMVLTIGMAIDASILIFEKIREELAGRESIRKSIAAGFSDAIIVILDSNITTFLVGMVLYRFGTGPIQGFAVTMMIGIIATLITGLFFLRSLFNVTVSTFDLQKLSI